jgi:hypothetical protein
MSAAVFGPGPAPPEIGPLSLQQTVSSPGCPGIRRAYLPQLGSRSAAELRVSVDTRPPSDLTTQRDECDAALRPLRRPLRGCRGFDVGRWGGNGLDVH